MKNSTIKDLISSKTHPYRIKVYKVRITTGRTNTVWYASRKGEEFYAVLSIKNSYEGYIPTFRVVNISDAKTYIIEQALIRDIHPNGCTVIEELTVRSSHTLAHLSRANQRG
jgi:hypothetical protein